MSIDVPGKAAARQKWIAGVALALAMPAVIGERLLPGAWFAIPAALAVLVAVVALLPSLGWQRRIFVAIGAALAVIAAATRDDWWAMLADGLASSAFIAAFFTAQACLRSAAVRSPAIEACGRYIADQPPGRRYAALTIGAQGFGLVLAYGSLSLLGSLAETSARGEADPERRRHRRRRMLLAIQRGFVSTLPWSPLGFLVAITTAKVPGASWEAMVLPGIVSALILAGSGWALDTVFKPRLSSPAPPPPVHDEPWHEATRPLLILLAVMAVLVGGIALTLGVSAPIAVMIVVPPIALGWVGLQHSRPLSPGGAGAMLGWLRRYLGQELPGYGGEITLLAMAGLIGTLGGQLAQPWLAGSGIGLEGLPGALVLLGLMWMVPIAGQVGMNPILAVALAAPLLPDAASFGASATAVAVAIACGWSLSGITSPFTATTLIVGSLGKVSATHVGLRWNGPYTLVTGLLLSGWTLAVHAMTMP
ncbi:MAG: hypothetical protein AAF899_07530 [Pseudomonadota bacterium]